MFCYKAAMGVAFVQATPSDACTTSLSITVLVIIVVIVLKT